MQEDPAVIPEEWGITGNNEDGVCKYCQLMLHSDAPKVVRHQPNLESLVTSTCRFCGWVEVSIAKGIPELAMRYSRGDPKLHDPNDTSSVVTLELSKEPMYTRLVASVGPRRPFMDRGLPMISVRVAQLGEFFHCVHVDLADIVVQVALALGASGICTTKTPTHCLMRGCLYSRTGLMLAQDTNTARRCVIRCFPPGS
jgi:hypothetical protein